MDDALKLVVFRLAPAVEGRKVLALGLARDDNFGRDDEEVITLLDLLDLLVRLEEIWAGCDDLDMPPIEDVFRVDLDEVNWPLFPPFLDKPPTLDLG